MQQESRAASGRAAFPFLMIWPDDLGMSCCQIRAVGLGLSMSESRAVIFGCAGPELSPAEAAFFADTRPWGFILFGRNIASLDQVAELTGSLRECIGRPDAPVLIDQEGGRVQRFKPPLVPQYPSGADLGALYGANPEAGLRATWIMSRLHAFDLYPLGINVDCLPVLDVPSPGGHEVIGSRAYGITPEIVSVLGGCRIGRLEGRRHAAGDQAHSRARPCRG
jgi:beta-N-acetylhexosaminidase